jgi:hypothetical protein
VLGERCINRRGKKIVRKELQNGVVYSNAKGWCTREIFEEEVARFSKYLKKNGQGKSAASSSTISLGTRLMWPPLA